MLAYLHSPNKKHQASLTFGPARLHRAASETPKGVERPVTFRGSAGRAGSGNLNPMAHGEAGLPTPRSGGGKVRRTGSIVVGVVAVGLAGTLVWLVLSSRSAPGGPPVPTAVPTGQAAVVRTDVAERNQFSGSLGHAGTYTVIAPATGTLTRSRDIGQVVRQGESLYEVDGEPVLLMYGKRPVWRPFSSGMSNGPDVAQLRAALKALGYGPKLTVN
jgi:hypothetical protein